MLLRSAVGAERWLVLQSGLVDVVGAVGGVGQSGRTAVVGVDGLLGCGILGKECGWVARDVGCWERIWDVG